MIALIDDAVAARPDGLVVSFPEPGLGARDPARGERRHPGHHDQLRQRRVPLARRARARRPARGPRRARRGPAARARGRAARAVRQPAGRQHRPRRALRRPGAGDARRRRPLDACSASTTRAPPRRRRSRSAVAAGRIDGDPRHQRHRRPAGGRGAWRGAGAAGAVRVAAFDLGPDTLRAVEAGKLLFAVDQQPYLQGYLPVVMLATAPATGCCRRRATWSRRERTSSPGRTPRRRSSSASARSAEACGV